MMKPPGVGYWWRREVLTESLGKSYPVGRGLLVWEHKTQHGTEEAILMPNTVQPFHSICGLLEFYFGDRNTTFSGH